MPNPVATPAANKGSNKDLPARLIPFTRASIEHEEPFDDRSITPTASSQSVGPIDVPAYGFMRHLKVLVEATGGTGTAAVYQGDAPFTIFSEIALIDVNGAPIIGPFSGWDLYLSNKYTGLKKIPDPKQHPSYVAPATSGNFSFMLRLPVEICNRDALGALANQNSSSAYKLRYTIAPLINVYSTNPTTIPSVRVRTWLEAWSQPAGADGYGRPQATTPPGHGTTRYFSKTSWNVPVGASTQRLTRVGNYVRNVIFCNRTAAGVRSTTNFPDPFQFNYDTRLINNFARTNWLDMMAERHGLTAAIDTPGGLDTGVFVMDFCHEFDGRVGEELRDGWIPTLQSTRLDVQGSWGAASIVDVITEDVSPTGEIFL